MFSAALFQLAEQVYARHNKQYQIYIFQFKDVLPVYDYERK